MSRPSAFRRWLSYLRLIWFPRDVVAEREAIRKAARRHTLTHLKG